MAKRARSGATGAGRQRAGGAGSTASWGQLLRRYRGLAGLTQEELAERSGYSTDYISKLERDQRQPPLVAVDRLAQVLGLGDRERAELRAAREGHDARAPQPGPGQPIGRARELAEIHRHLAGLGPRVLLLAGEPGIGKTRLLEEAAARATECGWRVIQGGCQRRAQDPYAPLTAALARSIQELPVRDRMAALQGSGWLSLLLPELTTAVDGGSDRQEGTVGWPETNRAPEQERRLLFVAVARYLRAVAGGAGIILVLDDLHWAGADALDLLAALVTSPDMPSLQLIGAYRDTEVAANAALSGLVADLARASLVRVLSLGQLSEEAAAQLLAELLPAGDERQRALLPAIVRRAGGVPFFLISYAEALRRHEGLGPHSLALPWTVAQVIRQRVVALPETVRELLGVAAVIGPTVPPTLLRRVTGVPEDEVLTGLEVAAAARLLDEDEDAAYRFRHDLIRETIEGDLSAGRRRLLHRRVGEMLEQEKRPSVESLAFHFGLSDDDDKAMCYLERAGTEAQQRCAHAAAADFFRRTIERSTHAGRLKESASTREKLGSALYMMAKYDEAIDVLERAVELYRVQGNEEGVRRAAGRLAEAHFRRGTGREAVDRVVALAADDRLGRAGGGSEGTIALREGLLRLLFGKASYKQMLTAGRSLVRVGRATGNARLLTMGQRAEGAALIFLGRLPEGVAVLERSLQREPAADEVERIAEIAVVLSSAYLAMGSLERSEALSRRILPLAESLGDRVTIAAHTLCLGVACHLRGEWEEARTYLQRADALFAAAGPSSISVRLAAARAPCLIWEGQWEQARRYLEHTLQLARSMRVEPTERIALSLLAELDLLEGRPKAAVARVEPLRDADVTWNDGVLLPSTLAAAYLALSDVTQAEPLAERALAEARRMETWTYGIGALGVRAMIEARQGNQERARRTLEEGLRRAQSMPFPYGQARLLETYALLDHQRGDNPSADARLAEALAIFKRLGARRDIERLRVSSMP
jgi:tetratricopeptide (TPR) repeat protein/transcriptional regulator with XRE-family HTH domain